MFSFNTVHVTSPPAGINSLSTNSLIKESLTIDFFSIDSLSIDSRSIDSVSIDSLSTAADRSLGIGVWLEKCGVGPIWVESYRDL